MTRQASNKIHEKRLLQAAHTLTELNKLGVQVIDIDLSTTAPVLTVYPAKGLHRIVSAWCRSIKNVDGHRVEQMRGMLADCVVQWEVRP
jgi:hypothetical protein